MRIDIDTYKEIIDTISRNKARSLLTGFGVFWGIFMLVGLLGSGQGLKDLLSNQLEGFATNSALIFCQPTTKPYQGYRKGRQWNMSFSDISRLREQVGELDVVTPMNMAGGQSLVVGDRKTTGQLKGIGPDYGKVEEPHLLYGRYINEMDMAQRRKVCVIGKKVYSGLFPGGGNPCGQLVKIGSTYFDIVGVDISEGNMNIGSSAEETVLIPITLMQETFNLGDEVQLIAMTGKPGVKMSSLSKRLREVIGRPHSVDPTDEKAITIINTEAMFGMVDSLFDGVNLLILIVGIGTLLAGAIGVSNIMMVTVKERTTEIGIRRAIGATPRNILSQIITESLLLTIVAGMSGILFTVLILQMIQLANTSYGVVHAHFQIGFWTAVAAVAFISALGVLAGLAPAARAMSIKPVDAMRDE